MLRQEVLHHGLEEISKRHFSFIHAVIVVQFLGWSVRIGAMMVSEE
jgi:hypothetical protein